MATVLRLTPRPSTFTGAANDYNFSASKPQGAGSGPGAEDTPLVMATNLSAVFDDTVLNVVSAPVTTNQSNFLARWESPPLAAQTIAGQVWTVGLRGMESDAGANAFARPTLAVYRPSTGELVGRIFENLGAPTVLEFSTSYSGRNGTYTGSEITVAEGDVLVLEVWIGAQSQATAAPYTTSIQLVDGETAQANGSSTAGYSFLSTASAESLIFADPVLAVAFSGESVFDVALTTAAPTLEASFAGSMALAAVLSGSAAPAPVYSRSVMSVRIGRINTLGDAERALRDVERSLGMITRGTIAFPEIVTELPDPTYGPPLVLYDGTLLRNTGVSYVSSVRGTDITGPILGSQIADASLTTAKFAANIAAPEVVDELPSPIGGPQLVYLTTDKTLYRNAGDRYTAEVAADLIVGQLTAGQIAAGAIGADQIAADAIRTEHLHAESVTSAKIAALAIETNHIAASAVTADQIAANAITSPKIAANQIESVHIIANAILSAHIAANQILAGHIEAGAITTEALAAEAVTAAKIAALAIEAGHLAVGAVTADAIAANAVQAIHIAAGAVTTAKLTVGFSGAALNPDPNTIDSTAWEHLNTSIVTTPLSPTGRAIRNDPGTDGQVLGVGVIPVDPSKRYRATMVAWANGADGTFYPTVKFMDEAGANIEGPGGTYWYFGAYPVVLGSAPARFTTTFKVGEMFSGVALVPATARFMTIGALLNYGGTAGEVFVADLRLEEVVPETLIEDGAISTVKLAAEAVTATKIAAGAIETTHLAAGAVTTEKLDAGAVTAEKIAAEAITAEKIAAGAITAETLDVDTLSAISADLGTVTAGYIRNADHSIYINLYAAPGSEEVVFGHAGFQLLANGSAIFSGNLSAAGGTFSGTVASSEFSTTEALFAGTARFYDQVRIVSGVPTVGSSSSLQFWAAVPPDYVSGLVAEIIGRGSGGIGKGIKIEASNIEIVASNFSVGSNVMQRGHNVPNISVSSGTPSPTGRYDGDLHWDLTGSTLYVLETGVWRSV